MIYKVIYESYCEYNQFEGSWLYQVDAYGSISAARRGAKALKKSNNNRNIIICLFLEHI